MVNLNRLKELTNELELKYEKFKNEYDELEDKYKFIVENLNEGIWQIDIDGNTTYINKRGAEILDYTQEEIIGTNITKYTPKFEMDRLKNFMDRRKVGISEVHEFEFLKKNGTCVYCLVSATSIIINGEYKGAVAAIQDITDLKESQVICKGMADSSFDPMVVHRNGVVLDVNEAFIKLSGLSKEQIIGKNSWDLIVPKESLPIIQEHVYNKSSDYYVAKLEFPNCTAKEYLFHGRTLKFNGYSDIRVVVFREAL